LIDSRSRLQEGAALVPDEQPNILVIWGDDIGITNLRC